MSGKLWVDDVRPAPDDTWVWMLHSDAAIAQLSLWKRYGVPVEEISLDHDLGDDDTSMPIIEWMAKRNRWPKTVTVHSANPVGRANLLRALNADAPPEVDIYTRNMLR